MSDESKIINVEAPEPEADIADHKVLGECRVCNTKIRLKDLEDKWCWNTTAVFINKEQLAPTLPKVLCFQCGHEFYADEERNAIKQRAQNKKPAEEAASKVTLATPAQLKQVLRAQPS